MIRCLLLLGLLISTAALAGKPSHGFAYFGTLKYPADMPHFDYVNPKAPKDGIVRWPVPGTFNNLNSYVDKGILPSIDYLDSDEFMEILEEVKVAFA